MRSTSTLLNLCILAFALSCPCYAAVAAVEATIDKPPLAQPAAPPADIAPLPSAPFTKIAITPHRAIYDMTLTSVKNGSNITGVTGRMLFEWADVCDGWAVQQHLRLHFSYAEGDDSDVTSTEVTWEAKDRKHYNFNIRRTTDGKETERYVGKAVMDDAGGLATYSVPADKKIKLIAGTLFPSAHTILILEKAAAKEKLFSRRVFDGSDEEGQDDVSAFISQPVGRWQDTNSDSKVKDSPLLSMSSWPVRLAFFKTDTETGESDYEMNLNLMANGVARTMQIDYGDFSVTGVLSDVEALPSPPC